MKINKPIILTDPFPRTLGLIFTNYNLQFLKSNFKLIAAPKSQENKKKFYENHIGSASYIIGQPNLPTSLLKKATNLKAIFNVESNFLDNMDYDYCFNNGIYVLSTSPVFAQPVAEMAIGLTLSIARSIHIAHNDFIHSKEKYGGQTSKNNFLLKNKNFGLIGFGDLAKALVPLLLPFSNNIFAYDPWVPKLIMKKVGVKFLSLDNILKDSDVIYILATITSSNKGMINYKKLSKMKDFSTFVLMSRAAIINFDDLYKCLTTKKMFAAIDVFPQEPFPKNHKLRKLKNIVFSPHRAGALDQVFNEMGDIVLGDLKLINNNLPPRLCKKAERETVKYLQSKPVDHN